MTHLSSGGNITSLLCVKDCTLSNQLAVKELSVWAGENRIVTLPEHEVDLKASVVPAPPAETTYSYEWSLVSHPGDYQDEIKDRHTQTLNLSHLLAGLYAFKVAVSSDSAFGEGFVNVTVKPGKLAAEDGLVLCGFVSIPGARITSQSISNSYIWLLLCSFVFLSEFCVILSPCLTLLVQVARLPLA